ncbi:MAG TPA: hypothetical protein VF168_07865 [Trueperaceae bacterium]
MTSVATAGAPQRTGRTLRLAAALSLLAAGGLLFEISLTRLLSVLFFSTYSYLVLSIAVLGLAAGAALARLSELARHPRHWPFFSSLAALAAVVLTLYALGSEDSGQRFVLLPLTALPYLFIGVTVTGIFARRSDASPRLYLADLAGAGAGALLAVPLLDLLGGPGGMLAAALAPALAGSLLAPRSAGSLVTALLVAAAVLLHSTGVGPSLDLGELSTPKPIRRTLRDGASVVETRWNSFARTDLVHHEERDRYLIYLDGGAGSLVPDASRPRTWLADIGSLAFAVDPPESVFLIGPGGGLDIALTRSSGARRLVAAEINESAVALTRSLVEYAGDLYGEGTELIIDDGRSALRRRDGEYDLILLSQVVSGAAEARGLALVENGLYTVEAFDSYLDHLSTEGRVALKLYDELTLTRAMTTALATLERRGEPLDDAARHLFAALDTSAQPPVPLLLVNGAPLTRSQAVDWARVAEARGYALLYVPGLIGPAELVRILAGEAGLEALTEAGDDVDLRPTTDERPFFYQFERGLPRALRPLAWGLGTLLLSVLLLFTLRGSQRGRQLLVAPAMVACLGAGFMLVEIGVLQRAQLLIGHPSLTLATVLATLLLGAACGSGLAARCRPGAEYRWIAFAGGAAALLAVAWSAGWPLAARLMRSLPAAGAAAGTAATMLPVAFALGVPFPLLLRSLGRLGAGPVATAWLVNGVASVTGAVAATALAIVWGFDTVAWAASGCYALVALLSGASGRNEA